MRIATFGLFQLLVWLLWSGLLAVTGSGSVASAASPFAQIDVEPQVVIDVPVAMLLPSGADASQITVHTADFRFDESAADGLSMTFEGLYRLSNESDAATTISLDLLYTPADNVPSIELSSNGFPLSVDSTAEGYRTDVQIAAESTADLVLRYTYTLPEARLFRLGYDVRRLAAWTGNPSLRIVIDLPASLPAESWLSVSPDGWTYAMPSAESDLDRIVIHWLYDAVWPPDAIAFWSLFPQSAQELSALSNASTNPTQSLARGDFYTQIYLAMRETGEAAAIEERLYAQALAAYTAGLNQTEGTDNGAIGPLWAGLARLYRSRVVDAGTVDVEYMTLMVQAATSALRSLPQDDVGRQEVVQWQADGLRQLLADAQQRRDWPTAVALLDQMARLPDPPLSAAVMAEERRAANVLHALTLLEAGQHETAIELAGEPILDDTLQPDADLQSLFSSWQISMLTTPDNITVDVVAHSVPERADIARETLVQQLSEWQIEERVDIELDELSAPVEAEPVHFVMNLADRQAALALAQRIGAGPDWVFLRTLLAQIAPIIRTTDKRFTRSVSIEQSLDLRQAEAQWISMAENLEQRAEAIEAGSRGANVNDPAAIEESLRSRIEAANYRTEANVWRNLATSSWVSTSLTASESDDGQTYFSTASSPAQTYTYQAESRHTRRLVLAGFVLVILLLLLSILLWRLL